MSQAELAEKTGLGKTAVSLLVNERQDYSPATIRDISAVLNISPYELLMPPSDAMALRQLRRDAAQIVRTTEAMTKEAANDRTGTNG